MILRQPQACYSSQVRARVALQIALLQMPKLWLLTRLDILLRFGLQYSRPNIEPLTIAFITGTVAARSST